jgi:hypothetical protein
MKYTNKSPYYETSNDASGKYLDMLATRNVPALVSDFQVEVTAKYNLRPDLLAYDLYGDSRLWWVFAERNPNALKDPVGDFRTGVILSIPDKQTLFTNLGI